MVLGQLLPMAEQLLEKIQKEPSAVLKDEATVLHLILGKYNEYSAALLHKDPMSLDIFIKAVHTTEELFTGMPSIQITALEKVSDFFHESTFQLLKLCDVLLGEDEVDWTCFKGT